MAKEKMDKDSIKMEKEKLKRAKEVEKRKAREAKVKEQLKAKREKAKDIEVKETKQKGKKDSSVFVQIFALIIIAVALGFGFVPLMRSLNFGLDLQGGFEVLYKVESIDGSSMTREKINATFRTLNKRIDSLGVSEPEIIIEGNDRIRVKLAGVTNAEEARSRLSTVATLTFRDSNDILLMTSDVLRAGGSRRTDDGQGKAAVLLNISDKSEFHRVTSSIAASPDQMIVIWLDFEEGVDSFNTERTSCGTAGSRCLSAATVTQGFASDVIIQGNFTDDQVSNLVELINSGSLPTRLTEISSKTVGASFGDATLGKTLVAGIVGVALIMVLLIAVYKFAGLIASVAIMIYTFLVFLVFWTIGGVLTLPGIAALVLGIGMAIDSNVITFARIKEELYKGHGLEQSFKQGSKASLRTIIDSEATTLLVAIVMFIFGESSVKGFSTMLIITILVTMFTMVFLSRMLLKMFINTKYFNDKIKLFIGVKEDDIPDRTKNEKVKIIPFRNANFLRHAKKFIALSLVIIAAGTVVFAIKGFNLGIDFQAGSAITLETSKRLDQKEIESDIKELDLTKSNFTQNRNETSIMVREVLTQEKEEKVTAYFKDKYDANVDIGVVSNIVKEALINNAIFSVIIAMIGIIIYIGLRFKFSYAIAAVVGLLHDVLVMTALFTIFQLEMTTMFIAAVLAIIGYSINNTIVTFDRIKENLKEENEKKLTYETFKETVNRSIREIFTRSIYTSITTLIPIVSLIVLGSAGILNFNLAMLFGLIAGTYCSLFIVTTIFILLEKRNLGKEKQKKVYKDDLQEKQIEGINC